MALIKAKYPHLAPALVVRALAQSAQDSPRGGYSDSSGFGLINPLGALKAAGRLAGLDETAGAASPGSQVSVRATDRFLTHRLPVIDAVHHSAAKLDQYYALIGLGVLLLLIGIVILAVRPRARSRANQGAVSIS